MAWVNYSQHLSLFFCLTVILSQLAIGFHSFSWGGGVICVLSKFLNYTAQGARFLIPIFLTLFNF